MATQQQEQFKKAIESYEKRDYDSSKRLLTTLIESRFRLSECYYYLGLIDYSLKDFENAKKHFIEVKKSDSSNYHAIYFLGELLEKEGDFNSAVKHFKDVLDLKQTHSNALSHLNYCKKMISSSTNEANIKPTPNSGDIYDLLNENNEPAAKAAIKLIDKIQRINIRPRFSAFIGRFTILPLMVLILGIVLFAFVDEESRHSNQYHRTSSLSSQQAFAIKFAYIAFWGVYYIYFTLRLITRRFSFNRGIIEVRDGVFWRTVSIYEIYRLKSVGIKQNLLNRITADGTLVVDFDRDEGILSKKSVRLKGFDKYQKLKSIALDLRSLHLQLRTTNVGKGIIQ